jgi:hypothetical protein
MFLSEFVCVETYGHQPCISWLDFKCRGRVVEFPCRKAPIICVCVRGRRYTVPRLVDILYKSLLG